MKSLPISVLIPTMNRLESLKTTVNSFISNEYIPAQIVVVDQSQECEMQNEIKNFLSSLNSTRIEYIYQNFASLTKARNLAWKAASEEIVICSDDDVFINADTLKNIYDIIQDESVAMIAGIDENTPASASNIGYLLGTKSFANRKIGHVTLSMLGRYPDNIVGEIETQWAMGYFFAVKKSLADNWDIKWDEKLTSYAYAEDLDFSYRYYRCAKAMGLRCVLNDRVKVKHMVSKEYRIPSRKNTYMYVINRAYLSYKLNMGLKSRIAMRWCDFWKTVERILKKQNPYDIISDIKYAKKHRADIRNGIISYE